MCGWVFHWVTSNSRNNTYSIVGIFCPFWIPIASLEIICEYGISCNREFSANKVYCCRSRFIDKKDFMSNIEDNKELGQMEVDASAGSTNMPSPQKEVLIWSSLLAYLNLKVKFEYGWDNLFIMRLLYRQKNFLFSDLWIHKPCRRKL